MHTPYTVEDEIEWERGMLQLGAEQFDERNAKAPFQYSPAGRRFIRATIEDATKAIEKLRKDTLGGTGRNKPYRFLAMLEAETIALYVLGHMAGITVDRSKGRIVAGAPMLGLSKKIAKSLEDEINLRHLVSASRRASERWRTEKGIEVNVKSLVERIFEEDGYDYRKVWRLKQMYKDDLEVCEMTDEESTRVGSDLIKVVVDALPNYWDIDASTIPVRGQPRTLNILQMRPELYERLEEVTTNYRMHTAHLMPMLVQPKQWETA